MRYALGFLLIAALMTGCENQPPDTVAISNPTAPVPQAPATPITVTITDQPIAPSQASAPNAPTTQRVVASMFINNSGNVTLTALAGQLISNTATKTGKLKLIIDGTSFAELDITTLKNGDFDFTGLNVLLVKGQHVVRLELDSNHGTGDTIQTLVNRVTTDATSSTVVYRWSSILCG